MDATQTVEIIYIYIYISAPKARGETGHSDQD